MRLGQTIRLLAVAGVIAALFAGCSDDSDGSNGSAFDGGAAGEAGAGGGNEGGASGAGGFGESGSGGAGGAGGSAEAGDCAQGLIECEGTALGECVDPLLDPEHCGECGNACGAGFVCSAGTCALSCQAGLIECDGLCINPKKSLEHCGAGADCAGGLACRTGEVCSLGNCARSCQVGLLKCGGTCIDPDRDPVYCGAIADCSGRGAGTACAVGSVCIGGVCQVSCAADQIACDATCVSPLKDLRFCGATLGCGNGKGNPGDDCADGEVCSNGKCALSCQPSLVECEGTCVDPLTDRDFCGARSGCGVEGKGSAGMACQPGFVCNNGVCSRSCPNGTVKCDGSCFDPKKDRVHCGATFGCGVNEGGSPGQTCDDGEVCSSGSCLLSCQPGLVECDSTCVNPKTDRAYCGATAGCGESGGSAGVLCDPGYVCNAGECSLSCADGLVNCGGFCVDPAEDRAFCGATPGCGSNGEGDDGEICEAGFVCNAGECALSCPAGLVNCNGACVDPMVDRSFCGATNGCGQAGGSDGDVCAPGYVCSEGDCALSCAAGLVDCSGACVDPDVDRSHCGATPGCGLGGGSAGDVCEPGFVCNEGTCDRSCQTGLVNCDSACIDPAVDRTHCGATAGCGVGGEGAAGEVCAPGYVCNAGACSLSCPTGLVNCNGRCVDPNQDRTHCGASGACGTPSGNPGDVCDPGEVCNAGTCSVSCAGALVNCDGTCIDATSNRRFCGATPGCGVSGGSAGERCDGGEICNAGHCALSCPSGYLNCQASCIDPLIDRDFCGATPGCGRGGLGSPGEECDRVEVCNAGSCGLSCQAGRIDCGGGCVAPTTNRSFCGATEGCGADGGSSGDVCLSGQVCVEGACQLSCQSGFVNCNDVCIDPNSSQAFCGASAGCSMDAGTAGETCEPGHVCIDGQCELSCPIGLVDCGGSCIDPDTNRLFCGATPGCGAGASSEGSVCDPGFLCVAGACTLTCPTGLVQCGQGCIDPLSNPEFCGASGDCTGEAAGEKCAQDFACVAGACLGVQPP